MLTLGQFKARFDHLPDSTPILYRGKDGGGNEFGYCSAMDLAESLEKGSWKIEQYATVIYITAD